MGNTPKKSAEKRIFALVLFSFLTQTGFFLFQFYSSSLKEAQSESLKRLKGISISVASQIDGSAHESLMQNHAQKDAISTNQEDENYDKIHAVLKQNAEAHGLQSPIYTLLLNPETNHFEFGVTSSEKPYFRHKYAFFPSELTQNKEIGGTIPLYKDEFGSWLSAFSPVKNKEGKVVALLMADENMKDIIQQIINTNVRNLLISLLIFGLLILKLLYLLRKVIRKEENIKKTLESAVAEKSEFLEKLRESDEQLQVYAHKLEKSNKELTDFAHIASHDLKSPVRGIASFIQLLERRNKDKFDERDAEYVQFIKTNAQQSLALIENLLNYSTVDKNIGEAKPVNVSHSVEAACNNLKSNIDARNVQIVTRNLPIINAHSGLLIPLFQNLINNGIKYNQSFEPIIEINAELINDEYIFSVKDNGIGIAENYRKGVFDMFKRLHSSAEYEGSGIGLAFCSRIIQTYNGRIWLDSELGKGSIFYFTLPTATVISEPILETRPLSMAG